MCVLVWSWKLSDHWVWIWHSGILEDSYYENYLRLNLEPSVTNGLSGITLCHITLSGFFATCLVCITILHFFLTMPRFSLCIYFWSCHLACWSVNRTVYDGVSNIYSVWVLVTDLLLFVFFVPPGKCYHGMALQSPLCFNWEKVWLVLANVCGGCPFLRV